MQIVMQAKSINIEVHADDGAPIINYTVENYQLAADVQRFAIEAMKLAQQIIDNS